MEGGLAALIAGYVQAGRVRWIGLRGARLVDMQVVDAVQIGAAGLDGDHGRAGKRAVSLIQAEHLAAIGSYLGRGPVGPEILRRNLVVEGLNLSALKGRRVQVGDAVLKITTVCAPCSRMEAALGKGGYSALRGHGGWCAEVIVPGAVTLGSAVVPLED